MTQNSPTRGASLSAYAATIFLSAFLLFQIQPIIAKSILPWFGGTAAVWTTCLLFFQVVLLLGYLYAHASIRCLNPQTQARLHAGLLLASLPVLLLLPQDILKPTGTEEPTSRILLLLLVKVGLPYFLISATSPLLQAWYARGGENEPAPHELLPAHGELAGGLAASPEGERVLDVYPVVKKRAFPYRLYALSNAGSLLGLLSYPFLVEPRIALHQQAWAWAAGYVAFALLCASVAWQSRFGGRIIDEENDDETPPVRVRPTLVLYWIFVAACSSTLLLAVTTHLTQNVAAIPLLWVVPLSLYLLSFIICFGGKTWTWHKALLPLPVLALAAMGYGVTDEAKNMDVITLLCIFGGGMFICCLVCHGELARLKPPPRQLTGFYLATSFGGALGGLFVAFVAPRLFPGYFELPLSIGACALVALFGLYWERELRGIERWSWVALAGLTLAFLNYLYVDTYNTLHEKAVKTTVRDFYGVLQIRETPETNEEYGLRSLVHGTILHGEQFTAPEKEFAHTTYYGATSGVGLAMQTLQKRGPMRLGVIGLGTGSMASWGRVGDTVRFYDINPLVVTLANRWFTYLPKCKADHAVVMGDARLSLEREPYQNYDVLVVDAFSSDSIPVHLLTSQAFALYFRHLKPDGVLAVHVSNRYLRLEPVVKLCADSVGKASRLVEDDGDTTEDTSETSWVLVTGDPDFFSQPLLKDKAKPIEAKPNLRLWTDDYSNLVQIMKAFNP